MLRSLMKRIHIKCKNIKQNISRKGIDNENILFENKIDKVKLLGKDLIEGNFEKLFNLVGFESEWSKTSLFKNAEIIYSYRKGG